MFNSTPMYNRLTRASRNFGDVERKNSEVEVRLASLKEQLDRNERRGQARQLLINQFTGVAQHLYGNYSKVQSIREGAGLLGAATKGGRGTIWDTLFGPSNKDIYYGPEGKTYTSGDLLLLGNLNRMNPSAGKKARQDMLNSAMYGSGYFTQPVPKLTELAPSVDMTKPITDDDIGG